MASNFLAERLHSQTASFLRPGIVGAIPTAPFRDASQALGVPNFPEGVDPGRLPVWVLEGGSS